MIACFGRNESRQQILIVPFEGGPPLKRIDLAGPSDRILWTADGKSLIYAGEFAGEQAILRQGVSGGLPEEIASFGEDEIFDFGYSFDFQYLAVTRGEWQHDVVLLSDLHWLEESLPKDTP